MGGTKNWKRKKIVIRRFIWPMRKNAHILMAIDFSLTWADSKKNYRERTGGTSFKIMLSKNVEWKLDHFIFSYFTCDTVKAGKKEIHIINKLSGYKTYIITV